MVEHHHFMGFWCCHCCGGHPASTPLQAGSTLPHAPRSSCEVVNEYLVGTGQRLREPTETTQLCDCLSCVEARLLIHPVSSDQMLYPLAEQCATVGNILERR